MRGTAVLLNLALHLSKAKGEVSLDYQLLSVGKGVSVLNDSQKVQADEDGQDVITPMIQHATTAISNQLLSSTSGDSLAGGKQETEAASRPGRKK